MDRSNAKLRRADRAALLEGALPEALRPRPGAAALELLVLWGDVVLEAGLFAEGPVRAGAKGADLQLSLEGAAETLAVVDGERALLTAPRGGRIEVFGPAGRRDGGGAAAIGLDERARIDAGELSVIARFVRPPPRAGALGRGLDLYFSRALAFSGMAHLAVLAMLVVTPAGEGQLGDALVSRRLPVIGAVRPPPKVVEKVQLPDFRPKPKPGEAAAFHGRSSRPGPRRASDTGLLAAVRDLGGAGVFDTGLGGTISNHLDRLQAGGEALNMGVEGTRAATGPGGGGGGGLKLGGIGIGGGGPGRGRPGGLAERDIGRGGPKVAPCKGGDCPAERYVGGLDKDVIGKVIRRHTNQVRYCYERELQLDPALEGKLAVQFVIGASGAVIDATAVDDTVGRAVSSCVLERIRRWKFPEPTGGGEVIVTYPWVLRSGGGGE